MTVERVESAENALVLLEQAAQRASDLQKELNQMGMGRRVHNFVRLRWGVTVPTGNYSSARLDAEVAVDDDADPAEVLRQLKSWVGQHAPMSVQEAERLENESHELQARLTNQREQWNEAQRQWERIERVFERLGIPIPSDVAEDLPF